MNNTKTLSPALAANNKAQTPPVLLAAIITLKAQGPSTAKSADVSPANMNRLVHLNLVQVKTTVRTSEGAGRPAHVYALTALGRKRASRAIARLSA